MDVYETKHVLIFQIRDGVEPTYVPALPRSTCDPKKTYVITGGLGGFGLELADWLVNRGARKLILTSRSGIKTGYQRKKLSNLAKRGAEIAVSTKNVCNKEEAVRLFEDIKGSPVGGVFHLAVVGLILLDPLLNFSLFLTFKVLITNAADNTFWYFIPCYTIVSARPSVVRPSVFSLRTITSENI